MCKCKICGEDNPDNFYKRVKSKCKKCSVDYYKQKYKDDPIGYSKKNKEYVQNNVLKIRWFSAKHRAIRKGIEFNITVEDLEELFKEQQGRCYYTGVTFNNNGDRTKSISIDRIDSTKGYTKDNIRLICSLVNNMKSDKSEKGFLACIEAIYLHTIKSKKSF